jgi:hypothetical protein
MKLIQYRIIITSSADDRRSSIGANDLYSFSKIFFDRINMNDNIGKAFNETFDINISSFLSFPEFELTKVSKNGERQKYSGTYTIIPKSLTGDVGKNIKSGKGKKIVWDAQRDLPIAKSSGFKTKIVADDHIRIQNPNEIIGKDGAPMVPIPAGDFFATKKMIVAN